MPLNHAVEVKRHQTVKKVTEGLEELRYNTSIAALMELVNTLRAENSWNQRLIEELIVMLAPFAPHFAEENWERLGHEGSIFDSPWPTLGRAAHGRGHRGDSGAGERQDPLPGDRSRGTRMRGGGGGGAAGCGGAAVYRGERGAEGGVRAEPVAEFGGQLVQHPFPNIASIDASGPTE